MIAALDWLDLALSMRVYSTSEAVAAMDMEEYGRQCEAWRAAQGGASVEPVAAPVREEIDWLSINREFSA